MKVMLQRLPASPPPRGVQPVLGGDGAGVPAPLLGVGRLGEVCWQRGPAWGPGRCSGAVGESRWVIPLSAHQLPGGRCG